MHYQQLIFLAICFLASTCLQAQEEQKLGDFDYAEEQGKEGKEKRHYVFAELTAAKTLYQASSSGYQGMNISGRELGLGTELRYHLGAKQRYFVQMGLAYRYRALAYSVFHPTTIRSANMQALIQSGQMSPPEDYRAASFRFHKLALRLGSGYSYALKLGTKKLGISAALGLSYDPNLAASGDAQQIAAQGSAYHEVREQGLHQSYAVFIEPIDRRTNYAGFYCALAFEYPLVKKQILRLSFELQNYFQATEQFEFEYQEINPFGSGSFRSYRQRSLALKLAWGF